MRWPAGAGGATSFPAVAVEAISLAICCHPPCNAIILHHNRGNITEADNPPHLSVSGAGPGLCVPNDSASGEERRAPMFAPLT